MRRITGLHYLVLGLVLGFGFVDSFIVYPDEPLWQHAIAWYVGVGVWVSLAIPIRTGRSLSTLKDVGSMTRVLVGLTWPLCLGIWIAAHFSSKPHR